MDINEEDANKLKSYLSAFVTLNLSPMEDSLDLEKRAELLSPLVFLEEISRYAKFFERKYADRKFRRYIQEETHYHLELEAWRWISGTYSKGFKDSKFTKDGKEMTEEEYQMERDKVLMAFTLSYVNRVKAGHGSPANFIGLKRALKSLEQLNSID